MISSLHVATGGALGAATNSRLAALVLGPLLHLAGDLIPHDDIRSRRYEIWTGVGAAALLGVVRGFTHPTTLGGIAAAAPDLEHVVRLPRPGGRKLFPTHRSGHWGRSRRLPTWLQLLAAGAILGAVVSARRASPPEPAGDEPAAAAER